MATKSRDTRDAARARLCSHLDCETVEEKGQNCLFYHFPQPKQLIMVSEAGNLPRFFAVIDNSHMGTRLSADQRSN